MALRGALLMKIHQNVLQNIIFEVVSEVENDSEDISAGICKYLCIKKYLIIFLQFEVKVGKVKFDLTQSN